MIISFDNATKRSGYAVFDDTNSLIDFGVVKHNEDIDEVRIINMANTLIGIMDKHPKSTIVLENPTYFRFNINTYKQLNMLYGILLYKAQQQNSQCYSFAPNTWRKILGFSTRKCSKKEKKQMAIDYVKLLFNVITKDNDVAEAICLGCALINKLNFLGK